MSRTHFLPAISLLALAIGLATQAQQTTPTLREQAAAMPQEFRAHFFDTPLSARVMLDGKVLGDAMITLSEDEQVRIINFTDATDSQFSESERQRWLQIFTAPQKIATCEIACNHGLMAISYHLNDSRLVLITAQADQNSDDQWYSLPEKNAASLIMNNQLNATAGQNQASALSWNGGLDAAIAKWTLSSQLQLDRSSQDDAPMRHAVTAFYAQREFRRNVLRTGLFTPDSVSLGLVRQPSLPAGGLNTVAGVMYGSSETLMKDNGSASLYPVYVTANREGIAEIYRNGTLLNTQPVEPGLQTLDTTSLPMGIYEVEIRIIEDGRETSRSTETINKPTHWRNPAERLRYNVFVGQQQTLWNSDKMTQQKKVAGGVSLNYLLHPRATAGVALQQIGNARKSAVSLDWQPHNALQLYSNAWRDDHNGYGLDLQAAWTQQQATVALNHNRSWYRRQQSESGYSPYRRNDYSTSLAAAWRLNNENSLTGRIAHHSRGGAPGVDLGFGTRTTLGDTTVNWRLSGFDRPYRESTHTRNRGITLSASFPLGGSRRNANVSIGSRNDTNGTRDLYTSASLNQEWAENSVIRSTSATLTADKHGAGASTYNRFVSSLAEGSFWAQSATLNRQLSGGINTGSVIAIAGGKGVMTQQAAYQEAAGLIVDVKSDDPQAQLVALHQSGSTPLKAGRNFIPVDAWRPGTVQLDFPGSDAPALKIQPEYIDYHQIRGGVSTHEVRVMKTVTVVGRLVDRNGKALDGAYVVNHAGRTLTDSNGLFTLELHERNPVVSIEHRSGVQCEIHLNPAAQKQQEMIFAGNISCGETALTAMQNEAEEKNHS